MKCQNCDEEVVNTEIKYTSLDEDEFCHEICKANKVEEGVVISYDEFLNILKDIYKNIYT